MQAVNCLLRWVRRKDEACHGMVAGFLAGCSSYFYKSSTIALFSASKLAEVGGLPYVSELVFVSPIAAVLKTFFKDVMSGMCCRDRL